MKRLTSATVIFLVLAALRSIWSEPTPAVIQSFRFLVYVKTLSGKEKDMEVGSNDLCNEIRSEISRVEWGSNENISINDFPLENAVGTLLITGNL